MTTINKTDPTRLLESKIAKALDAPDITAAALGELITEVLAAIDAADATAKSERIRTMDPALSPDPRVARTAIEDAEFSAARLRTALPKIRERYVEVATQEHLAEWHHDYDCLRVERDALAAELNLYPDFASKIINLLARIASNNSPGARQC
jgi:hypothetical protein